MDHPSEPDWHEVFLQERLRERKPTIVCVYSGTLLAITLSVFTIVNFCAGTRSTGEYGFVQVFASIHFWLFTLTIGLALALFTHHHRDILPRHVQCIGFIPSLLAAALMPIAAVVVEALDMIAM